MNLTGTIYVNKRVTRSNWAMPRFSRPVWLLTNTGTSHGQQEEAF
jgi:hypothetical protein